MQIRRVLLSIATICAFVLTAAAVEGKKGTISGRVVNDDGRPISGAHVTASAEADVDATTDADGRFRVEVDPGEYRVQVEAEGYATTAVSGKVRVEAGREAKLGKKIEMETSDQGSVVRGSVFDQTGRSIPGARVVLERVPGDDGKPVGALKKDARSDSMGFFTFRVPPGEGRYRLTSTHENFATATVTVDVFGNELVNAPPLKMSPK
jgi:hypothetical protein